MAKIPVIVLAFANSTDTNQKHLQYLGDEIKALMALIGKNQDIEIHPIPKASISDIQLEIKNHKDRIVAFMYSGHAGQLQIETNGHAMSAIGLANELSACRDLKLVLLNGCSSDGHIPHLLSQKIPILITTEAPIEDKAATNFSATFWKEIIESNTVENAFELGRQNAQNYRMAPIAKITGNAEDISRGLDTGKNSSGVPWILKTSQPEDKEWSISDAIREIRQAPAFETNRFLKETLYRELAKTDEEINDLDDFDAAETEIYSRFPQFITKYIHDLCAAPAPTQDSFSQASNDYFTEPDLRRLKKMADFFTVLKELVKALTFAEIREALLRKPATTLPSHLTQLNNQLEKVSMGTITEGISFLKGRDEVLVKELESLDSRILLEADKFFREVSDRIETSEDPGVPNYQKLHPKQTGQLCEQAETWLSELLTQLLFIADYKFTTIKNIIVYKNRTSTYPSYGFKLSTYKWARPDKYDPSDSKERVLERQTPDNHCILIVRNTKDLFEELNKDLYLNLSPFLIDNNVLYDKAQIPDISFCEIALSEEFIYKRLHEPSADRYPIKNKADSEDTRRFYQDLKKQFDHFVKLLGKPGTHVAAS
jgi:hypothetical protein